MHHPMFVLHNLGLVSGETKGNMIKDNKSLQVRPKNWMVPVALVLLREEGSHGYELMERLEEFGFEEVDAGTLYRTLRRMEKEGLCESEWETSGSGPARRTYSVTDAGEEYLAAWAEGCKRYQNLMDCFYRAYESSR
jgi:PadR family transcriptional regulator PadR